MATLIIYISSVRDPKEKKLKQAEICVSLFMLVSYLSIIIEIYF